MPGYKLTYFNARGRAEIVRLVFAAAGVEYEDIRFERADWPAIKPTTPFGQVPVIEFDGIKMCQSNAIARYLARKFHLAGKTDEDQARADMIIDCFEDTMKPLFNFVHENDEARKETLKKKALEEQLPTSLAALEALLKANHGGDGFFVGTELTWADLGLISFVGRLQMVGAETQLAKYPKLVALRERVEKVPKVAAWLAKRPVTEF